MPEDVNRLDVLATVALQSPGPVQLDNRIHDYMGVSGVAPHDNPQNIPYSDSYESAMYQFGNRSMKDQLTHPRAHVNISGDVAASCSMPSSRTPSLCSSRHSTSLDHRGMPTLTKPSVKATNLSEQPDGFRHRTHMPGTAVRASSAKHDSRAIGNATHKSRRTHAGEEYICTDEHQNAYAITNSAVDKDETSSEGSSFHDSYGVFRCCVVSFVVGGRKSIQLSVQNVAVLDSVLDRQI